MVDHVTFLFRESTRFLVHVTRAQSGLGLFQLRWRGVSGPCVIERKSWGNGGLNATHRQGKCVPSHLNEDPGIPSTVS
jgi:hypothetical protein